MAKRYPVPGQKSRFEGEKSSAIKDLFSDMELKFSWEDSVADEQPNPSDSCHCNVVDETDDIHQPKKRGCGCNHKQDDDNSCGCGDSCKCK